MSIETMKQALEALCLTYKTVPTKHLDLGMLDEAITALRTAIEQAEKQEPVCVGWDTVNNLPILYTPPAAPVQVAAVKTLEHLGYTYHGAELWKPPLGKPAPVQEQFGPQEILQMIVDRALEKSAAQRQWVGLTDDEIDKTHETQVWDARRSYARAIEAKLKEKNT